MILLDSAAEERLPSRTDCMARTARAMQAQALDIAAQLERQDGRGMPPTRLDYPAEIKRWRAFAHQAEQIAERREHRRAE